MYQQWPSSFLSSRSCHIERLNNNKFVCYNFWLRHCCLQSLPTHKSISTNPFLSCKLLASPVWNRHTALQSTAAHSQVNIWFSCCQCSFPLSYSLKLFSQIYCPFKIIKSQLILQRILIPHDALSSLCLNLLTLSAFKPRQTNIGGVTESKVILCQEQESIVLTQERRISAWHSMQCNAWTDSKCIPVSSSLSLPPACADQHSKPHLWLSWLAKQRYCQYKAKFGTLSSCLGRQTIISNILLHKYLAFCTGNEPCAKADPRENWLQCKLYGISIGVLEQHCWAAVPFDQGCSFAGT